MGFWQIGERAIGQLRKQAGETKRLVRNDDAYKIGAGDAPVIIRSPNTQWLRLTDSTATKGFYPALLQASAVGGDLDGTTQVWLGFPAGYLPSAEDVANKTLFLGRQDANTPDGQSAFTAPDCKCHYQASDCCPECFCVRCNGNFPDTVTVSIPPGGFGPETYPLNLLNGSTVELLWLNYVDVILAPSEECVPFFASHPFFVDLDITNHAGWQFWLSCGHYEEEGPSDTSGWLLSLVGTGSANPINSQWFLVPEPSWLCNNASNVMSLLYTVVGWTVPDPITVFTGGGNNSLPWPELPHVLYLTLDAPCAGSFPVIKLDPLTYNVGTQTYSSSGDLVYDPVVNTQAPGKAFCNDGTCEYGAVLSCKFGVPSLATPDYTYHLSIFSRLIGATNWAERVTLNATGFGCEPIFWLFDYRAGSGLLDCNGNNVNFRGIVTA